MILINIRELCERRGIREPLRALLDIGISQRVAHGYLKGKKDMFVTQHIEKLCKLLRCQPNDILVWVPDDAADDYPDNPCEAFRKKALPRLEEKLKHLSAGEIEQMLNGGENE